MLIHDDFGLVIMAISAMDGGSVDVKRPLTPPADFMDVDVSVQE